MDAGITVEPEPLLRCPVCKKAEMKLVGIERHNPTRDLFTFDASSAAIWKRAPRFSLSTRARPGKYSQARWNLTQIKVLASDRGIALNTLQSYRQHAQDCRVLAKRARTADEREMILQMAQTWDELARFREKTLKMKNQLPDIPVVGSKTA